MTRPASVRVRIATSDDAPHLLPMFDAFYQTYFRPKTVEAIREHMAAASAIDTIILAEAGGVPLGFASLRLLPQVENDLPHAELSDLFVEERHRRRGVGRALVGFAESLALDRGAVRMVLATGLGDEVAKSFYRSVGFVDHAIQMTKDLEGGP